MRSKFRIELEVVVDSETAMNVIQSARQYYAAERPVVKVDANGVAQALSAREFIDEIEDALIELSEHNPLLADAHVEIECVSCRSTESPDLRLSDGGASARSGSATSIDDSEPLHDGEGEDDLEELETGLYLCRWPNGEFSLVKAADREDAVVQLDEWAGAEPSWLEPVETCMIDFRLNDRAEIELAVFGDETAEFIWEKCYPELDQVLASEDALEHLGGKPNREVANRIRRAVEHERKRLWRDQKPGTSANTAMGRELQKRLGTVGAVADRYVEIAATEILQSSKGEKGKPN
jgi:hypothetical protein